MQNRKVVAALGETDLCFNTAVAEEKHFLHTDPSLSWEYCSTDFYRLQLAAKSPSPEWHDFADKCDFITEKR